MRERKTQEAEQTERKTNGKEEKLTQGKTNAKGNGAKVQGAVGTQDNQEKEEREQEDTPREARRNQEERKENKVSLSVARLTGGLGLFL